MQVLKLVHLHDPGASDALAQMVIIDHEPIGGQFCHDLAEQGLIQAQPLVRILLLARVLADGSHTGIIEQPDRNMVDLETVRQQLHR